MRISPVRANKTQGCRVFLLTDGASGRLDFVRESLAPHFHLELWESRQLAALSFREDEFPSILLSFESKRDPASGRQALRERRAHCGTRPIPFLVLTEDEDYEPLVGEAWVTGDNYLVLPCSARELLARVRCQLQVARLGIATARALTESEALNRSILENSRDRISLLDLEGRLLLMNRTGQQILKIQDIDIYLNRPWLDLWAGSDRESADRALQAAQAGSEGRFEGFLSTATGEPKWWDVAIHPILDGLGQPERLLVVSRDVTERHLAWASLQASEARYQRLVEDVPAGIYRTTPDGQVLLANAMLLEMLGYSSFAELAQLNLEQEGFPGEESRQSFKREIEGTGEVRGRESIWLLKDGSCLTVRENARAIRDSEGKTLYYDGVVEDVSEARKTIQALQESEERLRVALLHSPLIVYNTDRDLRYTWINRAHPALHVSAIIGKRAEDLLPAQTAAQFTELKRRVLRTGIGERREIFLEIGGSREYYDVTVEPLRDAEGSIQGITVSALDITERARGETERARLLEVEQQRVQQLRGLAQAAIQITAALSVDLILKMVTEQARVLIGVRQAKSTVTHQPAGPTVSILSCKDFTSWEEQTDSNLTSFLVSQSGQDQTPNESPVLSAGPSGREADAPELADGVAETNTLLGVSLTNSQGNIGVLEVSQKDTGDFTASDRDILVQLAEVASIALETKRLTEWLERTNHALEKANLNLQQFAYSASHDLREPLRTVALYSQLLQQQFGGGKLDADADLFFGYVTAGCKRMEALVRDLLIYVQAAETKEEGDCRADANLAFSRALCNLSTAIEECDAIVTSGALPVLAGAQVHLDQLLQNLVGNALKYRGRDAPRILVTAERREEEWLLCVTDNGIGIDEQYQKQIFGIFKRLHGSDTYAGTGIGLAICQRIVDQYGGRIWVESTLGQGSRFCFTFPADRVGTHG